MVKPLCSMLLTGPAGLSSAALRPPNRDLRKDLAPCPFGRGVPERTSRAGPPCQAKRAGGQPRGSCILAQLRYGDARTPLARLEPCKTRRMTSTAFRRLPARYNGIVMPLIL